MNAPRSLLLGRHPSADARLDLIRARTIASIARDASPAHAEPTTPSTWRALWIELFFKPRLAWAGIGACGLLAISLNGLTLLTSDQPSEVSARPLLAVQEAVRERAQLLAELRGQEPPALPQPAPVATPDRHRRRSAISPESRLGFA